MHNVSWRVNFFFWARLNWGFLTGNCRKEIRTILNMYKYVVYFKADTEDYGVEIYMLFQIRLLDLDLY